MEYKIGDKVKIRKDLEEKNYGSTYFNDEMMEYRGKEAVITEVENAIYKINLDNSTWDWTNDFLVPLKIAKNTELESGDIVTLRNGDKLLYNIDENFYDLSGDNDNNLCCIYDLEDNSFKMEDRDYKDSDIVKIERPISYILVYEENQEVKEMTLKEICEELGYNVKIVKEEE